MRFHVHSLQSQQSRITNLFQTLVYHSPQNALPTFTLHRYLPNQLNQQSTTLTQHKSTEEKAKLSTKFQKSPHSQHHRPTIARANAFRVVCVTRANSWSLALLHVIMFMHIHRGRVCVHGRVNNTPAAWSLHNGPRRGTRDADPRLSGGGGGADLNSWIPGKGGRSAKALTAAPLAGLYFFFCSNCARVNIDLIGYMQCWWWGWRLKVPFFFLLVSGSVGNARWFSVLLEVHWMTVM